jgi:hypothetical protein
MKEKITPKRVSGRLRSQWEQQGRKNVTQKEGHGKKLKRTNCGKTETDEEA